MTRVQRYILVTGSSVVGILFAAYIAVALPPKEFSPGIVVVIEKGRSAQEVAVQLVETHVVKNQFVLEMLLRLVSGGRGIQAGAYKFDAAPDVFTVAYRLHNGIYGLPAAKITITEGMSVREIAAKVAATVSGVTEADLLAAGLPNEGYLFPDTYFFQPGATATTIVATMRSNFDDKISTLQDAIASSTHSLSEIITMASLIEKEARTTEVRRIISGILWNRIARDMPLQVDAVFGYIFKRDTYSPSYADLKVDSPYNTYTHRGLPPSPINNPGLDSIESALNPVKTKYLYYLVDPEGGMHYATTFAEHQANQRKYLK